MDKLGLGILKPEMINNNPGRSCPPNLANSVLGEDRHEDTSNYSTLVESNATLLATGKFSTNQGDVAGTRTHRLVQRTSTHNRKGIFTR